MRKSTLEPNAFLQAKQRLMIEGLPEAGRVITRDTISLEVGVIERPDKTVIPAGRIQSGEFNVKLDFGDDILRQEWIAWFFLAKDRAGDFGYGYGSAGSGTNGLPNATATASTTGAASAAAVAAYTANTGAGSLGSQLTNSGNVLTAPAATAIGTSVTGIDPTYKRLAYLTYHRLYADPNAKTLPLTVKLLGCWVKSMTMPDFDMDGEEASTLECAISYDDVIIVNYPTP